MFITNIVWWDSGQERLNATHNNEYNSVLYSSFARPRKGKRTTFKIWFDFPISVASFRMNLITDFRCNDGFNSQIRPFNNIINKIIVRQNTYTFHFIFIHYCQVYNIQYSDWKPFFNYFMLHFLVRNIQNRWFTAIKSGQWALIIG